MAGLHGATGLESYPLGVQQIYPVIVVAGHQRAAAALEKL
jgi:hypothetical protein